MKRKLLSLTLAAVLALSLTACGGGNDAAETTTDAAETTEELLRLLRQQTVQRLLTRTSRWYGSTASRPTAPQESWT